MRLALLAAYQHDLYTSAGNCERQTTRAWGEDLYTHRAHWASPSLPCKAVDQKLCLCDANEGPREGLGHHTAHTERQNLHPRLLYHPNHPTSAECRRGTQ